ARAAGDRVVAVVAEDGDRARSGGRVDAVVARAGVDDLDVRQDVIAFTRGTVVRGAVEGDGGIRAGGGGGGGGIARTAVEDVGAVVADEDVVAVAGVEAVGAAAAGDGVVARAAGERGRIAHEVSVDGVVAGAGDDTFKGVGDVVAFTEGAVVGVVVEGDGDVA